MDDLISRKALLEDIKAAKENGGMGADGRRIDMEKLTEYVDGKYIRIKGTKSLYPKNERDGAPLSNAIARLAAYEETRLEPEDMKKSV